MKWANIKLDGRTQAGLVQGDEVRLVSESDVRELLGAASLAGEVIATGEHCYGCAAGQGSSCGGALGS